MTEAVALLTFDVFGTIVDWRRGLGEAVAAARGGGGLSDEDFERVIDLQAELEQEQPGRRYRDITAESLRRVAGLDAAAADAIGAGVGRWPLFPDAADGMRRLARVAPCVATTNSDRAHRTGVEAQLGFALDGWICAEDVGCYKPSPAFFGAVAERRGVPFGPAWHHVSAYADYDLVPAAELGLSTVFVTRPHAREAPVTLRAASLVDLARQLGA